MEYPDRRPARHVWVKLDKAFGSREQTETDETGSFRFSWLSAGRFRIAADLSTGPADSRYLYYPGVSSPEDSQEIVIGEEQKFNCGVWTLAQY